MGVLTTDAGDHGHRSGEVTNQHTWRVASRIVCGDQSIQ